MMAPLVAEGTQRFHVEKVIAVYTDASKLMRAMPSKLSQFAEIKEKFVDVSLTATEITTDPKKSDCGRDGIVTLNMEEASALMIKLMHLEYGRRAGTWGQFLHDIASGEGQPTFEDVMARHVVIVQDGNKASSDRLSDEGVRFDGRVRFAGRSQEDRAIVVVD